MKKYYPVLMSAPLFSGLCQEELELLFGCLGAVVRHYKKEEAITLPGDDIRHIGIVLEGKVQAVEADVNGNRNIFSYFGASDLFGEVFVCAGMAKSPLTITAVSKASVLFLEFHRVLARCTLNCVLHTRLIENMLRVMASKTISLNEKLSCVGCRSIREKVETFLTLQMKHAGQSSFDIPFSRLEMADYLCVDRSALSAVLCKMRDEGLISFHRNRFELLAGFTYRTHSIPASDKSLERASSRSGA